MVAVVAGDDDNGASDDIDGKDDVYPVDAAADNAEPDNSFVFVPVLAGFIVRPHVRQLLIPILKHHLLAAFPFNMYNFIVFEATYIVLSTDQNNPG